MVMHAAPPAPPAAQIARTAPAAAGEKAQINTLYLCPDGHILAARFPDARTAVIVWRGQDHVLAASGSADGARYIGGGWQLWTKGSDKAALDPLPAGATIAPATNWCTAGR